MGLSPAAVTWISDIASVSSKDFLNIQTTIECRFTLKCVRDMIRTYNPWLLVFQFNFSFRSFSFTLWIWNTFCCIVSLCISSKSVSPIFNFWPSIILSFSSWCHFCPTFSDKKYFSGKKQSRSNLIKFALRSCSFLTWQSIKRKFYCWQDLEPCNIFCIENQYCNH